MRKLIIIAAAMLTPFAMWTAGCRQKNVAFPNGPEVKNLSRSGEKDSRIPDIAVVSAAIDREVLAAPDQPTYARIRAVMDREARLASRYSTSPGLFMLPDEGPHPSLAHAQLPEPAPYVPGTVQAPLQSQREFWSRPVRAAMNQPRQDIPGDVSAMVPAAAFPDPVVVTLPPAAPMPVVPVPAPMPAAPLPAPIPIPVPMPELLLPPEVIPGVYMGDGPLSQAVPGRDYDALASSWLAMQKQAVPAEQPSAPSPATFDSVAVKDIGAAMAKTPAAKSVNADNSAPAAFKPDAGLPARLAAPDIRLALAPLPDLFAGLSPPRPETAPIAPARDFMAGLAAFMPGFSGGKAEAAAGVAEPESPALAAAPAPKIPSPEPPPADFAEPAESASVPAANNRDMYMMDFWEAKPSAAMTGSVAAPIVPEQAQHVEAESTTELARADVPENVVPERVTLDPVRAAAHKQPRRTADIERIDAATDVPPLRF